MSIFTHFIHLFWIYFSKQAEITETSVISGFATLLEDKSEEVREAAVKSLALVVATLPKTNGNALDRVSSLLVSLI